MTDELRRLQGVWFPAHYSVEGQPPRVLTPAFPAPRDVALVSVVGDEFHASANAEYHWTGGRLVLSDGPGVVRFVYPGLPEQFHTSASYRLTGDEWLVCSRPPGRGRQWYDDYATRYIRVAAAPTPEMLALFEEVKRWWRGWAGGGQHPGRSPARMG